MKKEKILAPDSSKLSGRIWFNLCLFNLIGGIAWNLENMYFNTFLYNSVYAGASQEALLGTMSPTTAISRMVALSAITAVLTTFVMGTFSDRLRNRKIFISIGYIVWGAVTALFGFITRDNIAAIFGLSDAIQILTFTVWTVIIMDMVMTFRGSKSNDSAFNAWVTDVTTTGSRPKVETTFTFVGFLAMGIVMGVGSFAQAGTVSYKTFFGGLGLLVVVSGIIGLFSLKEPEHKEPKEKNTSYWADLFYGFKPSVIKQNSQLYLILSSICIFNSAFQVFFPFLFVYLQYVVLADEKNSVLLSSVSPTLLIVAVVTIVALVAGIIILMKLSNKNKFLGFIPGVILLILGLIVFSSGTSLYIILAGLAPTLIGYLVLTIQLNAAIRDFTPPEKTGLFQGIRMIFVVLIPMVVGPAIGDIACRNAGATYTNEYGVETIVPDVTMFIYSAVLAVLVFIPLLLLKKKGLDKKEIEG
ncbi:MAG: MFS transporter [Clostridia bacterium]|nr:MFS transporter [Clostridia bacterium]